MGQTYFQDPVVFSPQDFLKYGRFSTLCMKELRCKDWPYSRKEFKFSHKSSRQSTMARKISAKRKTKKMQNNLNELYRPKNKF